MGSHASDLPLYGGQKNVNDRIPSIAEILNFVNSFHEQCGSLVRDAVRLLRDKHQIYLTHKRAWDYATKPGDHFLEQDYGSVRRTWLTYVPDGNTERGALFYFDFFHPHRCVTPALIYGEVYPGVAGFDSADRWASFYTTTDAEKGDASVSVAFDGPIVVVTGTMPKRYEESMLVRVPLETITDQLALERIVVHPLAAMLRGKRSDAISLLSNVTTDPWPTARVGTTEEEENEPEEA
jgi:hypothetical protein